MNDLVIAIASGKGGTGKTTLAVNLARALGRISLLDCDVEEPNAHLFFNPVWQEERVVNMPVPDVDKNKCTGCGECGRFCNFNAIAVLRSAPLTFPELCHGCGGCATVCPTKAIREVARRIGVVRTASVGHDVLLVQGCLDIGVPLAPPVVRAVKTALGGRRPAIIDAPPGTSCSVVAAVQSADFVVLVTEPTVFGLYDLRLAVDMLRTLRQPCGVVINRMGIGDDRVHAYCCEQDLPILMEIPDDRRIAEAYSRGLLIVDAMPVYKDMFLALPAEIRRALSGRTSRYVQQQ